jgi:sugar phosphate permease
MIEQRPPKSVFYGIWIIAGCFVLIFLFAGAGFYSFSIFIKPLEEQFGWSRGAISLTMSIYMTLHGIVGPFVGHLTQTYGPKRVMTLFALGSGTCFILVSFTHALWFFYISYALLAVANSGIGFIPVSSLLSRWFIRRRGTAIGAAMVGISVGGFVLSPIIGQITLHFGWRVSYVFLGILVWLLAVPVTLFVIKGSPLEMGLMPDGDAPASHTNMNAPGESINQSITAEQEGWPIREAFKTRSFFWILLTFFLAPLAQMGVLQHQVPLIVDAGISEASAAAALGLTAGLGGLGKLSFGRVSEILPFRYTAMICFGLQALGVFVLLNAHSMPMVWLYVAIFGFAMGGVIVLLPLVVSHFYGLAAFGVIMGAVTLAQSVGNSSGTLISGLIYDFLGGYHYALIAYICIYLTAILTIFMAGKPKPYPGT